MNLISSIMEKMIVYFENDVHQINHAIKVYGFAKTIGELEGLSKEKQEILEITAILHDIGIPESMRKYSSSAAKYQEEEGPPIARNLLKELNLNDELLDRVYFLIGHHHSYNYIDDVDFQILVEADFFVNIFEKNLNKEQIETIKKKNFKTESGIKLLNSMYL